MSDSGTSRSGTVLLADPIVLAVVWCLLVTVVFLAAPSIDLWLSGLFYDPARGFLAGRNDALKIFRRIGDWGMWLVAIALLLSLVAKIAFPDRKAVVPPRASLFLLSALIVGPGLLVNMILKEHWGRPRPVMVTEFGGDMPYVAVWRITDYCARNCSFVAGEASSALWLMAIALVVPRGWRWPVLIVTGALAVALSLNRIAFGGHFLSDVLLSWGLTALVIAILYRLFYVSPPGWLRNDRLEAALTRAGRALRRPFVRA
jgi:lipid A 4'-phosphatase